MHDSVRQAFPSFSVSFEGRVPHPYVDVLGLVTVGIGNLIDPMAAALKLPWTFADGTLASQAEIAADWNRLKAQSEALKHLHYRHAERVTRIRLTPKAIDDLVAAKLESNARHLRLHHFPFFEEFPADAQLGILSLAWAVGPDFPRKFPRFTRSVLAGDWLGALEECAIGGEEENAGVIPRNGANRVCFRNGALVLHNGADRTKLYWPAPFRAEAHAPEQAAAPAEEIPDPLNSATEHLLHLHDQAERAWERNRDEAHRDMSDLDTRDTDPSDLAPESGA